MDPLIWALLLTIVAGVLIVAETFLPTHGVLGILGAIAACGAVIAFFVLGAWTGVAALALIIVLTPLVFMGMMRVWPHTPVGKRLVLSAVTAPPEPQRSVSVGQAGRAVTELRPIGECDFGEHRLEVISEIGLIAAGAQVKVIGFDGDGRPIVRVIAA